MNKTELIDALAAETSLSKVDSKKALDGLMTCIQRELATGGEVALTGFGTWSVRTRPARTGRNPQTGKPVEVAERKNVKFKGGSDFRKLLNAPKKESKPAAKRKAAAK